MGYPERGVEGLSQCYLTPVFEYVNFVVGQYPVKVKNQEIDFRHWIVSTVLWHGTVAKLGQRVAEILFETCLELVLGKVVVLGTL